MTVLLRAVSSAFLAIIATVALATAASAQDDVIGNVEISFDVGEFDEAVEDWAVDAVEVTGDLEEGAPVTIELLDEAGKVLWTGTERYTAPELRIEVSTPVAVGDVASAGASQPQTVVAGVQVEPPVVEWSAGGGGGSGQLALSMVMAVIIVAIVFRSPLPSASVQRWTK